MFLDALAQPLGGLLVLAVLLTVAAARFRRRGSGRRAGSLETQRARTLAVPFGCTAPTRHAAGFLAVPYGCAVAHTPSRPCGPTCAWEPTESTGPATEVEPLADEGHPDQVSSAADRTQRTAEARINLSIKVIDQLILVVCGTATPTDEEWGEYVGVIRRNGIDRMRQLIYTDGGEPSAPQRWVLNKILGGRVVPVAVVSGSAWVRGTVTVLSWFNRRIRAFAPSELHDAVADLEIPRRRHAIVQRELHLLQLEVARAAQPHRRTSR